MRQNENFELTKLKKKKIKQEITRPDKPQHDDFEFYSSNAEHSSEIPALVHDNLNEHHILLDILTIT